MRYLLRAVDTVNRYVGRGVSVLVPIVMFIIVYEIVLRGVFGHPNIWAFDLVIYMAGTVYMVGGAYAHQRDSHVRLDLLYSKVSQRRQALLNIIVFPFFVLFVGALLWKGGASFLESFRIREVAATAWRVPVYPFRLMIPAGALLMLLQGTANVIRDFRTLVKGDRGSWT